MRRIPISRHVSGHFANKKGPSVSAVARGILLMINCLSAMASADVSVPGLFSDHMVLQSGREVPVWGTAGAGESVTVEFGLQQQTTTADANGNWSVTLAPMAPSTSASDMIIQGNNVITITDVQVGEVWLGSGQSNMANRLRDDCDATAAIADARNYNIRFFNVGSGDPSTTTWQVADENTAANFSAVHFYFGRHLAQQMPVVPIGLIVSAVSATAIERWATCAGAGGLYRNQIEPLQPYAIAGVTWYQGEWDTRSAGDAEKYYWQLPCLIDEWRTDWGQGELPFFVVQLPGLTLGQSHVVRDAEWQAAQADPNTRMTVNIDYPGCDVHPACKDVFGQRLGFLARKFVYEHDLVEQGPVLNAGASTISGDTIVLAYDNLADGLQATDNGPLAHWEIAGADGAYFAAIAEINGDTVHVWSASVPEPARVRYAFEKCPANPNLINSAGLPASPLREFAPNAAVDTTTPTPDPMTWASPPAAADDTSIAMTATTASDASGVEYLFACVSGPCHDSGWQDSPTYTDTGLSPGTTYAYRVQARDNSPNQNTTAWSTVAQATTTGGSCTPTTVHVDSIVPAARNVGKGNKVGSVAVTVRDDCANSVSEVTVMGSFSGDFNETRLGSTDGNGVATIETVGLKKGSLSYDFCVDELEGVLSYDANANVETCDSL